MSQYLSTTKKPRSAWANALISMALIAGLVSASSVYADGYYGKKGHDRGEARYEKMERLANKLDMTDEQEVKFKQILKDAKQDAKGNKGGRKAMRKDLMQLNPDDPAYMTKVTAQADEMAAQMKERIISHAKVRQQIYGILTDEQKQEMQKMMEKRMKKKNN